MTIIRFILMCVGVLCMMTTFLFLKHEKILEQKTEHDLSNIKTIRNIIIDEEDLLLKEVKSIQHIIVKEAEQEAELISSVFQSDAKPPHPHNTDWESGEILADHPKELNRPTSPSSVSLVDNGRGEGGGSKVPPAKPAVEDGPEQTGVLKCGGKNIDSEVIYWKIVPGDNTYESPITPHHGMHHDRYLSYEYDEGGWNNIRMGMECIMVIAHAMGRTLVVPPRENLYLLDKKQSNEKKRSTLGFDDFFDIDLLQSHQGYHVISTEEFLRTEGQTGGLHGQYPPKNRTDVSGGPLHKYLRAVADELPAWRGKFLVMPDIDTDLASFNQSQITSVLSSEVRARMKKFGGERSPVFYDKKLVEAHHIHFRNGPDHRLLQHHYAFSFFANKDMQSFYRRFVRDYLRYKDEIQCAGDEILRLVRADAIAHNTKHNFLDRPKDAFYALHIRRGDFQFKEVKLGAEEIMRNLVVDGKSVIPPGALVYLSTDDPKGECKGCRVLAIPCEKYEVGKKPVGCPEDTSWDAFRRGGWELRFLDDYVQRGALRGVNTNVYGMVESIVCSRATVFAGTYFSTFSGYIHRMRGYHGIGEETYYHSARHVLFARMKKSVGHGFSREWRAGWTDDAGEPI